MGSRHRYRYAIAAVLWAGLADTSHAYTLWVSEVDATVRASASTERPDQLPHSHLARGHRDIAVAWLAGPTPRYAHGVLGDALEASRLMVETREGDTLVLALPPSRVFEDLKPRLQDLDGDHRDEILLVESDINLGASLAVYGLSQGRIALRARTPFLGRPYRWLNPVGSGDFDGDGRLDVAIVVTPHIGGILRLYHFSEPRLTRYAEFGGVSTHQIGSTALGLGQVVALDGGRDGLLLPDQSRRMLLLLQWSAGALRELARVKLPAPVVSSLVAVDDSGWQFAVADGRRLQLRLEQNH